MTERDSMTAFTTRGFDLAPWQFEAVEKWLAGDGTGRFRGTLEIFTGGGKTLIALVCAERVARDEPDLRLAIVVPSEALARQWKQVLLDHTHLRARDIGMLGARQRDTFEGRRALICVLASAAKRLPEIAADVQPLVLVVDECHRAGAPKMARVLDTPAPYRLGLSATPDREEVDENGEPIDYDEHLLGRKLGRVVYRFSLRSAREAGWLPDYEIDHHGVQLDDVERRRYDEVSRQVDDAADRMEQLGADTTRARSLSRRDDAVGKSAQQYVAATAVRKDLLYRAGERTRIATAIVQDAFRRRGRPRVLLFHERVAEAEQLYQSLRTELPGGDVGIEHSKLSPRVRNAALDAFRAGSVPVLVSVKSLIEGVDVPEADVGVSVAASSSVRQRIQSLGRVLRRSPDGDGTAEMHLLYVVDTVDEVIYAKEDWSDLTGSESNRYWEWPLDRSLPPEHLDGPPRSPLPTEEQEWDRLGRRSPAKPVPYFGALIGREYSADTRGTVKNASGAVIANPQGVAEMIAAVRGRPGGRFFVTPQFRMVLLFEGGASKGDTRLLVAGVLDETFATRDLGDGAAKAQDVDATELRPGDNYAGPTDHEQGEFRISQRHKGAVERRAGRLKELALVAGADDAVREANARRVVDAWRTLALPGVKFSVNRLSHAWFLDAGEPRFLAEVPGGFVFPTGRSEQGERTV
jgi:superfamily II DNA or RNA helicase